MTFRIGCAAAVLGLVASSLTLFVILTVRFQSLEELIISSLLVWGMTTVAAILLATRDWVRTSATYRLVRRCLNANSDISDEQFLSGRLTNNSALLIETRQAVAEYFNVPREKLARDLHLVKDLRSHRFEPSFPLFILNTLIASHVKEHADIGFSMVGIETLDDLARAVQKILNDIESASST